MSAGHDVLLLRLTGTLMSFGGPLTDKFGRTLDFPQRSMLAGLLANALGHDHRDAALTTRLQERIRYAVRQDRAGQEVIDYQTVDLSQPFLGAGWTTRGVAEERGGASGEGTHVRLRYYLADACFTVALALVPGTERPTLDDLEQALLEPQRPLFLGRKCCLPSVPVFLGRVKAPSLYEALRMERPVDGPPGARLRAWWSEGDGPAGDHEIVVCDERDWTNQIHVGRRFLQEGSLTVGEAPHD